MSWSVGCDVILTSGYWVNSYGFERHQLDQFLWGYPHLVRIIFSEYADVRRRNIEQRRTRQNDREAAPAEPEKEVRPPQLSEPSTELWAHAEVEDVSPKFVTQGPDWYALFNPCLERSLDVSLVHSLAHDRCMFFTASTVWINNILFLYFI